VLGDGGPLSVPPHSTLSIAPDGTISVVPLGQTPQTTASVARIKLVTPAETGLKRGTDGLFRTPDGAPAPADANARLTAGALESSNVNIASAMMNMIELSRRFDLQVKAIRSAEDNGAASTQLLRTS
jgi:flagellar basal-body rod protein FlgF